jgi:hypothetical protein
MFVCEKLIFLQLQKTGGTHITRLLDTVVGGQQLRKHSRLEENIDKTGKLIVGSIRNPWDWYVSLWAYGCRGKGSLRENLTSRRLHGLGRGFSFHRTAARMINEMHKPVSLWRSVYADVENADLFRQWLNMLLDPAHRMDIHENYSDFDLGSFAGLLTHRYMMLYTKNLRKLAAVHDYDQMVQLDNEENVLDTVIRNESLESDLMTALIRAGYTLDADACQRTFKSMDRTNASFRSGNLNVYFDRTSADLVLAKEAFIIQKYGYVSPI